MRMAVLAARICIINFRNKDKRRCVYGAPLPWDPCISAVHRQRLLACMSGGCIMHHLMPYQVNEVHKHAGPSACTCMHAPSYCMPTTVLAASHITAHQVRVIWKLTTADPSGRHNIA